MIGALQIQGLVFSTLAVLLIPVAIALNRLSPQMEIVTLAVVIVLLGVPHGALDTLFVDRRYRIRSARGWSLFALLYFAPVAAVVAIWAATPSVFLMGFLVISMVHFSGDLEPGTPPVSRILYSGAIIILPALFHGAEVQNLFSLLVGPRAASLAMSILTPVAWPWLIGLVAACLFGMKRQRITTCEIASVTLLAVAAPPLAAFTIFFCGMHSARHIMRTVRYVGPGRRRDLLVTSTLPIAAICVVAIAALSLPSGLSIDTRIVRILFVGLAALTVPHMAIVERVRFAGWTPAPVGVL